VHALGAKCRFFCGNNTKHINTFCWQDVEFFCHKRGGTYNNYWALEVNFNEQERNLKHCTTSWKVAVSISDGVIGIFHRYNRSGHNMDLGSTQPMAEMSTRNILWRVKATGAKGWQPYHLHVPIVLKSGRLNLLEASGPVQACNGIDLPSGTQFNHYLHRIRT
jgi:hypothetical protein